tara:strand:- start:56 stop:1003 length:948 start_codon:yes stop_codon:yes gene_type:complete
MIDTNFYKKQDISKSPTYRKYDKLRDRYSRLIPVYKFFEAKQIEERGVAYKRILLTGHKGFIGNRVYDYIMNKTQWRLYPGFELDCIDLKDGTDIGDFRDDHPWWDKRYDLVIHLAAFAALRDSIENPEKFWVNNVEKSQGIFDYVRKTNDAGHRCKLLYASSAGAHGWWQNPYAITKKVNEMQAPPNSTGMRFFNVWAQEGSREDMLYRMLQDNTAKYITRHERDYIHVDDVVRAIMHLTFFGSSPDWIDVGTGYSIPVMEIAKAFGRDLPIKEDTPGEPQTLRADTSFLSEAGWYPRINIRDHLEAVKRENAK